MLALLLPLAACEDSPTTPSEGSFVKVYAYPRNHAAPPASSDIKAVVTDDSGDELEDVMVFFSADSGTFESGNRVETNSDGEAWNKITVDTCPPEYSDVEVIAELTSEDSGSVLIAFESCATSSSDIDITWTVNSTSEGTINEGEEVTFELVNYDISGCTFESVSWDFDGDGNDEVTASTNTTATHTYGAGSAGTYTVTASVKYTGCTPTDKQVTRDVTVEP